MIDSHCHLYFDHFDGRRDDIIEEARQAGVHTIINIGVDLQTSRDSIALAERYDSIYATVGVHPHDSKTMTADTIDQIKALTRHEKVVAIGEIGLDFYRDHSPRDVQRKAFRRQLELAVETRLPIVIHTREAFRDTVDIVKDFTGSIPGGVFHCFPGDADDAFEVIELGFHVSVGGSMTYKNSRMAKMATEVPLESILLETDAPFLTPVPFRGKTNRPAYVRHVCDKLAELKAIGATEVEKITDRNCQKLFRLVEIFGD